MCQTHGRIPFVALLFVSQKHYSKCGGSLQEAGSHVAALSKWGRGILKKEIPYCFQNGAIIVHLGIDEAVFTVCKGFSKSRGTIQEGEKQAPVLPFYPFIHQLSNYNFLKLCSKNIILYF